MKCDDVRRLLVMEEAREYGTPRRGGITCHLRQCDRCREAATQLVVETNVLKAAFSAMPLRAGFREEIRARLDAIAAARQTPMP